MDDKWNVNLQEERRHMTPENLTPIIALFDERFDGFKKELKNDQKEYIEMIERTYSIKIDSICKDLDELKNSDDHKNLEEKLNERFLTKLDMLTSVVKNLENTITKDQSILEKRVDDHTKRIDKLEDADAERAKRLVQKIKDNAIAWLVPTLLIALAIILGINIPGLK